jgi:3',5'-cyclic-AMP phosphodiesterase
VAALRPDRSPEPRLIAVAVDTRVENAELMSVGPREVVVTFTTEVHASVTTRVGEGDVTTSGRYHSAGVEGLEPETEYALSVEGADHDELLPAVVRTLAEPPGRLVATIAAVNDVHFGETLCGLTGDPDTDAIGPILCADPDAPPYPDVMGRAAVREIMRLDPDAVVVKGDLTDRGLPQQYDAFLETYGALGTRMHHIRGNHDAMTDPAMAVEDAPYTVELPGATLAVVDTTIPGRVGGALSAAQIEWLDAVAAAATVPVFVFGHHPVWNVETRHPVDPDYFIALDDTIALLDVINLRESIVGYFAGHTHTNRVRRYARARRVPCVEVACGKDYPGVWAEYRVYEGGYTQVVRRISAPDAMAWSERCRTMIQGIYRDLVLGTIDDRCFTHLF